MVKLKNTNFNDKPIRDAVIEFFKSHFKIILNETPPERKLIDLTGSTMTDLGVEVEHGKWEGNFWENDSYSLISKQEFRTINIPIRKEKYWMDEYKFYNKIVVNESSKKNIFVRSNKDFTQFIIIKPETIRDEKKLIRTQFQPNNSNEVENWLSFREEDVETYNLVDNKFILKTHEIQ
jgi:hypothetical protein